MAARLFQPPRSLFPSYSRAGAAIRRVPPSLAGVLSGGDVEASTNFSLAGEGMRHQMTLTAITFNGTLTTVAKPLYLPRTKKLIEPKTRQLVDYGVGTEHAVKISVIHPTTQAIIDIDCSLRITDAPELGNPDKWEMCADGLLRPKAKEDDAPAGAGASAAK